MAELAPVRTFTVIDSHEGSSGFWLDLQPGDRVETGTISADVSSWPGWVHCRIPGQPEGGWVPEQILEQDGTFARVKEAYSACELGVAAGSTVEGIRELNGWLWCRSRDSGQEGWLPLEKLQLEK